MLFFSTTKRARSKVLVGKSTSLSIIFHDMKSEKNISIAGAVYETRTFLREDVSDLTDFWDKQNIPRPLMYGIFTYETG